MKQDKISSILGLLFAIYIFRQSSLIDIGSLHQPGPGFFMLIAAILLAVCSIIVLLQSFRVKSSEQDGLKAAEKGQDWLIGGVLAALIVYALIFEWLGFILSTFSLVLVLIVILEPKSWWKMLLTAGLTSAGTYVIFNLFLKAGLPEGILGIGF